MCLIIYNHGGDAKIPESYIRNAYDNNPHGFGMMWADSGNVNTVRGIYDFVEIKGIMKRMEGLPYVVHFRYRTRGKIHENNCHPHKVLSTKIDGHDLYMMHNGTFMFLKVDEEESDSVKFAKHLRGALRVYGADSLSDRTQLGRMAARVGAINKLVFLRGDGKIAIVNKGEGFEQDGCWYSNTYSLKAGYRTHKLELADKVNNTLVSTRKTRVNDAADDLDVSNGTTLLPRNQKKNKNGIKAKNKDNKQLQLVKHHVDGKRSIVRFADKKIAPLLSDDDSLH